MDVHVTDDGRRLWGTCRVTTSTRYGKGDHIIRRVSTTIAPAATCMTNIQVADLNALNAVFGGDDGSAYAATTHDSRDHDCTFTTSLSKIVNAEICL
ncbi:MAG: hypothetical protein U5L03_07225 [Burkholderiaceae bacterium]|nr:hypothetical protein [Burkholderiaceae bacterium]